VRDKAFPGSTTAAASERQGVVRHLPIPDNDAALVEALRSSRPGASGVLFDRYGAHVRRVLVRVLGADRELPDLVHEVFVQVLESIDRLEDARAFKGWLTSITVFTARAKIRRRSRFRLLRLLTPSELDEVQAPSATPEMTEAVRCTYKALSTLPADERIAFALRFIDGMELTEVAAASRVSLATVKRRLSRAQQRFVAEARNYPELQPWLEGATRWS
jgi:RNA polymerase sigma-70 factor (ECF subfamily)